MAKSSVISLKIQLFRKLPKGTIPPSLIDFCLSGITFSKSTILLIPKPLQNEQAPYGELNEKRFGSGSG